MNAMPIIAIVGRPNVGKSTLFNRVVGENKAIVEDLPGVTRDRNYALVENYSFPFYLVDTGGYDTDNTDPLQKRVVEQTMVAVDEADIILCLFDGNTGLQAGDEEIVSILRGYNKTIFYYVNKCDGKEQEEKIYDFYALGVSELKDLSAKYGRNINDVVEETLKTLPDYEEQARRTKEKRERLQAQQEDMELEIQRELAALNTDDEDEELEDDGGDFEFSDGPGEGDSVEPRFAPVFTPGGEWESENDYLKENRLTKLAPSKGSASTEEEQEEEKQEEVIALDLIKIALVGKPNVGKSTLYNTLLGEERVITSDIAGTTRDSVDTPLKRDGQDYLLVDTAGLRKKARVTDNVEHYSTLRALKALSAADVCVLVIDALEGVSEQDTKIAGLAHDQGLGLVICINKWDAVEKTHHSVHEFTLDVRDKLKFARYAPIIYISALSGRRCPRVLDTAKEVAYARQRRIPTGKLNRILKRVHERTSAPTYRGLVLKFYFAAQVAVAPPRIALFFNFTRGVHFSYLRALKNAIRDEFGFVGSDIKLSVRRKTSIKLHRS
ncbi:MAG: ribosome biogenesis GTPase Der [Deltaproteobacteria bacterium]|nr:ribosome biogenesis GTPase Der [Deltaproteobacteria bacterium]